MKAPGSGPEFVPLTFARRPPAEALARARAFRDELALRRSVRHFSSEPLPDGIVDLCIEAAASAPSGAHQQPWTFVVVRDPALKREVRRAAEAEEFKFYSERITEEWRDALARLGTTWEKPFLEDAPALIAVFRHAHGVEGERKVTHYYTQESVGIACGFLLAALHHAGLATLTHTPSPMEFLARILGRPAHERAYLLIPVGYPSASCEVPNLTRKALGEVRLER
jgi:nitroreductase